MAKGTVSNDNLDFILNRVNEFGGIERLGKLFRTSNSSYFYDNGTGKVVSCEPDEYRFFEWLYERERGSGYNELCDFFPGYDVDDILSRVCEAVNQENLLMAPIMNEFIAPDHKENYDTKLDEGIEMITLELTESCNLRCGYCVYNEPCIENRDFSDKDMSKETLKASIDYIAKHSGDELAITFYGGEPLLKYDLIVYAVDYSQRIMPDKKLTYSMTTNLTLMTEEMARFFASIERFGIVCSIDGPEDVHDQYRKYPDGSGSFNDAIRGLKYLHEAYTEDTLSSIVSFSMVFAPPYTVEKLEKMQNFFDKLNWLPDNMSKFITYPSDGSLDEASFERHYPKSNSFTGTEISLLDWIKEALAQGNEWNTLFTKSFFTDALLSIHKRPILSEAMQTYGLNGSCVPGKQRVYINTDGKFGLCTMMGRHPQIGDIYYGIDRQKAKELYVKDYEEKSIKDCNECWAFKICRICYAKVYSSDMIDIDKKRKKCHKARDIAYSKLIEYHEFAEMYPEQMILFNEMTTE